MAKTGAKTLISLVTAFSGLVTVSCAGGSPSSPAIGVAPTTVAKAAGDHLTQLNFSVDLTVPAYPTCSVAPPSAGVIKGTGVLTVVIRSTTDGSGGTHIGTTIHGHGKATDQNGGSWTWSDADLNNELFPSGNTSSNSFEQTITEGFHVVGPNGQIDVKGIFHITMVNGNTVVEFEKGNHEDNEACESGFVLTPLP